MAWVADPPIYLAYEPTAGLDPSSAAEIMSILERLHASGKTVVLFTAASDLARHAERQIRMADGCVTTSRRVGNRQSAVRKILGE